MTIVNDIGLDVHKKTINYCVKDASGRIQRGRQDQVNPTRAGLLDEDFAPAMDRGDGGDDLQRLIYDHLLPHATQIEVAHPLMLRAIAAAKKKNDQIDASKLADCLRCDFLPECHMMPRAIRDRRRTLKYRHLLMQQMVQMKNRISGLLMETGVEYNKQRLHKVSYFWKLLSLNGKGFAARSTAFASPG
jgi:transposase